LKLDSFSRGDERRGKMMSFRERERRSKNETKQRIHFVLLFFPSTPLVLFVQLADALDKRDPETARREGQERFVPASKQAKKKDDGVFEAEIEIDSHTRTNTRRTS